MRRVSDCLRERETPRARRTAVYGPRGVNRLRSAARLPAGRGRYTTCVVTSLIHLDHVARAWVVGHRLGVLDDVMWTLSAAGRGGLIFAAIALAVAISRRRARDLVEVALALLLASALADYVVKPIVHRERPFVATPAVAVIGGRPHDASFPSGHVTNAFAAALTLTRLVPGGAAGWWVLAIAIAYSRVYVGVHYPADVIGGAILGLIAGAAATEIYRRIARGRDRSATR